MCREEESFHKQVNARHVAPLTNHKACLFRLRCLNSPPVHPQLCRSNFTNPEGKETSASQENHLGHLTRSVVCISFSALTAFVCAITTGIGGRCRALDWGCGKEVDLETIGRAGLTSGNLSDKPSTLLKMLSILSVRFGARNCTSLKDPSLVVVRLVFPAGTHALLLAKKG